MSSAVAATATEPPPDPTARPELRFHLTARPWQPLDAQAGAYLDAAAGVANALAAFQDERGQIIDPHEDRELGATTAYFAHGVGALAAVGRASPALLAAGVAAMESATAQFEQGIDAIDNQSGEFYLTPLTQALPLYAPHVSAEQLATWTQRMSRPREGVLRGEDNNWQTYAMRGEWVRVNAGLVTDAEGARQFIEEAWTQTQADRIERDPWGLYHDESSDPDTFGAEPVGRANFLALVAEGYDGPSAAAMKELALKGTQSSLFLQDPTGQTPGGGRTTSHTWNDALAVPIFERMAGLAQADGDAAAAGRYRRAAGLAFKSLMRWQRPDGSFWVTKNRFDPGERVGYSQASFFTNYQGAIINHLVSAYNAATSGGGGGAAAAEQPAPAEIGGYVLATHPALAGAFAAAGGVQMQASLRGSVDVEKNQYWTTLGVNRISRAGWDSRLGNVEALRNDDTGVGVSLAPTFADDEGQWVRLTNVPDRYQGRVSVELATPALTRFAIDYVPVEGETGSAFRQSFVVTPDGVMTTVTAADGAADPGSFGLTLPLIETDGQRATERSAAGGIAATRFVGETDELAYLMLTADGGLDTGATLDATADAAARGSNGDVRPVRAIGSAAGGATFIYPRSAADPAAADVAASFRRNGAADFSSALGRVQGDVYVGRTSAGGVGTNADFNNDGTPEITFSQTCGFIVQRGADGGVTAVETDRPVTASVAGRTLNLAAYAPLTVTPVTPVTPPAPPAPPPPDGGGGGGEPIPTPSFESEALTTRGRVGGTLESVSSPTASGGALTRLRPAKARSQVTFVLNDVEPGTYRLTLRVRRDADNGIIQIVSPKPRRERGAGPTGPATTFNLYAAGEEYQTLDLGTVVLKGPARKPKLLKIKLVGRHELSAGNEIELDSLTATPVDAAAADAAARP